MLLCACCMPLLHCKLCGAEPAWFEGMHLQPPPWLNAGRRRTTSPKCSSSSKTSRPRRRALGPGADPQALNYAAYMRCTLCRACGVAVLWPHTLQRRGAGVCNSGAHAQEGAVLQRRYSGHRRSRHHWVRQPHMSRAVPSAGIRVSRLAETKP